MSIGGGVRIACKERSLSLPSSSREWGWSGLLIDSLWPNEMLAYCFNHGLPMLEDGRFCLVESSVIPSSSNSVRFNYFRKCAGQYSVVVFKLVEFTTNVFLFDYHDCVCERKLGF